MKSQTQIRTVIKHALKLSLPTDFLERLDRLETEIILLEIERNHLRSEVQLSRRMLPAITAKDLRHLAKLRAANDKLAT